MIGNRRQWAALHKRPSYHTDRPQAGAGPRTCARCEQSQPIESFRVNGKGYRSSYCKDCALQVTQEWRERNRDELNARRRAAYAEGKGRT